MSDSLRPHGLQHTRLSCSSPTPEACLNLCPLIWWCHPTITSSVALFSSCLQSFPASGSGKEMFPSSLRWFSNESVLCIRWPKHWSFSFIISPSNEYSGLISFRIYCFDLFAVQGTLKNLVQHHSSKAWIIWCSAFFLTLRLPKIISASRDSGLIGWGAAQESIFNKI